MAEKKSFWERLFGGGHSGGCCNMEITEETQNDSDSSAADAGKAVIKIPDPGCRNCQTSEKN